jgi:hypothetical protein
MFDLQRVYPVLNQLLSNLEDSEHALTLTERFLVEEKINFVHCYIAWFIEQLKSGCHLCKAQPTLEPFQQPVIEGESGPKNIIFFHNQQLFYAHSQIDTIQTMDFVAHQNVGFSALLDNISTQGLHLSSEAITELLIMTLLIPNLKKLANAGVHFSQDFLEQAIQHASISLVTFGIEDLQIIHERDIPNHPIRFAHRMLAETLTAFSCVLLKTQMDMKALPEKLPQLLRKKDGLIYRKKKIYHYDAAEKTLSLYEGDYLASPEQLFAIFRAMAFDSPLLADQRLLRLISQVLGLYHGYELQYCTAHGASLRNKRLLQRLGSLQHIIHYLEEHAARYSALGENPLALSIRYQDDLLFNKYTGYLKALILHHEVVDETMQMTVMTNSFHIVVKNSQLYLAFCHQLGGYHCVQITHKRLIAFINARLTTTHIDFKDFPQELSWVVGCINANGGYDFSKQAALTYHEHVDDEGFTPFMRAVLAPGLFDLKQHFVKTLYAYSPNLLHVTHKGQTIFHLIFSCGETRHQQSPHQSKTVAWIHQFLFEFGFTKDELLIFMTKFFDKSGLLPLDYAIHNHHDVFVLKLLKQEPTIASVLNQRQQNLLFACLPMDNFILFEKLIQGYQLSYDQLFFHASGDILNWLAQQETFDVTQRRPLTNETVFHYLLGQGQAKLLYEKDLFAKAPELLFARDTKGYTAVDYWFSGQTNRDDDEFFFLMKYIVKKLEKKLESNESVSQFHWMDDSKHFYFMYEILLFCLDYGLIDKKKFIQSEPLFHVLERIGHDKPTFAADMKQYEIDINAVDSNGQHLLALLVEKPENLARIQKLLAPPLQCKRTNLDALKSSLLQLACLAKNEPVVDWLILQKLDEVSVVKERKDNLCALDIAFNLEQPEWMGRFWQILSTEAKVAYLKARKEHGDMIRLFHNWAFWGWNPRKQDKIDLGLWVDPVPALQESVVVEEQVIEELTIAKLHTAIEVNNYKFIQKLKHPDYQAQLEQLLNSTALESLIIKVLTQAKPRVFYHLVRIPIIIDALVLHAVATQHELLLERLLAYPSVQQSLLKKEFINLNSLLYAFQCGEAWAMSIFTELANNSWWVENYFSRHNIIIAPAEEITVFYPVYTVVDPRFVFDLRFLDALCYQNLDYFSILWYENRHVDKFVKRYLALVVVMHGDMVMLQRLLALDSLEIQPIFLPQATRFYNRLVCEAVDRNYTEIALFLIHRTHLTGYQTEFNNRLLRRALMTQNQTIIDILRANPKVAHTGHTRQYRLFTPTSFASTPPNVGSPDNISHNREAEAYKALTP